MAINANEARLLQPGDVIRIASKEEIEQTNKECWVIPMFEYCDKEVVVIRVDLDCSQVHVYMVPQKPHYTPYFFIPEWISEVVRRVDEYAIYPPDDAELQSFLFVKE